MLRCIVLLVVMLHGTQGFLSSCHKSRRIEMHLFSPSDASYSAEEIMQLSPNTLAYIGDAAFELFARTHEAWPPKRLPVQQKNVVQMIRAETQAQMLDDLLAEGSSFVLTPAELSYVKRGRNASTRRGPVRMQRNVYQSASALECLVGFLYLSDLSRCQELLRHLASSRDPPPS